MAIAFRRLEKLSRKDRYNDTNNEPWDQHIYESDSEEETYSRSQSRLSGGGNKGGGNTKFLTILVALLLALILIPAGAFFWITRDNDKPAASPESTTQVSKVSSTEKSSTEESSTEESTSSTDSEANQQEQQQAADQQAQQQAAAESQAAAEAQAQAEASRSAAAAQQTTPSSSTTNDANAQYGTVQAGEGPQQIAGRYGLSVDEFLRLNGMDRSNFYFDPGQQVRIK